MSSLYASATTPLQALIALANSFNCGASALQSLMIFPLLAHTPSLPSSSTAHLIRALLSRSDAFYPRINLICTLMNGSLAILAYRHDAGVPSSGGFRKWQVLAGAFALNVGVTLWSLGVQVPINQGMRRVAGRIILAEQEEGVEKVGKTEREGGKSADEDADADADERELKGLMEKWRPLALVRATMMMTASALGIYSVFLDGQY